MLRVIMERIKEKILRGAIIFLFLMLVSLRVCGNSHISTGIISGMCISWVNLFLLSLSVIQLSASSGAGNRYFKSSFLFRFPLMAVIFYVLICWVKINPVGICIGLAIGSILGIHHVAQLKRLSKEDKAQDVCCS
jgi:hypothetical protein